MELLVDLDKGSSVDPSLVGGKASALSRLISSGFQVPSGVCLTTKVFRRYIKECRLEEKILLEVNRKQRDEMRWEEMWDTALRIRGLFKSTPLPSSMEEKLALKIEKRFGKRPVAVRSSSTLEDSRSASHAGLHESYINIRGTDRILEHVRLVWASLWSDASLLLVDETGLNPSTDAMAVIVQELVEGEKSGVVFTVDPTDPGHGVIESVHGLNKGLVDGDVEPDRWSLRRSDEAILSHDQPVRDKAVLISGEDVHITSSDNFSGISPLSDEEVISIWRTARSIEEIFGDPQDVEWTMKDGDLYVLQSRPITTLETDKPARGSKAWNLTLKGSFAHLEELRARIENVHFPEMEAQAGELASQDLNSLDDGPLALEIRRRQSIHQHWTDIYWDEFIPMAHGVRIFGRTYNDVMEPEDPFQFVELLRQTPMMSSRRNADLMELVREIRDDPHLAASLEKGLLPTGPSSFTRQLELFMETYGDLTWAGNRLAGNMEPFLVFLVNMAGSPTRKTAGGPDPEALAREFVRRYLDGPEEEALRLLELGRASWRLRDDDNIYLGRIEGQLQTAVTQGLARLAGRGHLLSEHSSPERVAAALEGVPMEDEEPAVGTPSQPAENVTARQIVGQPAGKGLAHGLARVVTGFDDLAAFKTGEVLVCDAIDPNMTLLVPMACAIVERRGGMLIHGAIIARESGIPCVNGVPEATSLIRTGDNVTVDGYLGLVIVHS